MKLTLHPEEAPQENPFQKEEVHFKDLDRKKKLSFIWDYYKWPIIVVIGLVITLAISLPQLIENSKEIVLYSAFVNTQLSDTNEIHPLLQEFAEEKEIDLDGKRMMLDCSMIINHENPSNFSMECSQKLTAMFSAKKLDVVVADKETYENYEVFGVYEDLEKLMDEEFIEKYKDKLVYSSTNDSNEKHAYAIEVTDSKVLQEYKAYLVPAYFSIAVNAQHPENAVEFLEYLMEE